MATVSPASVRDAGASETLVRFHLSLNVGSLSRAMAFYRALFGVAPAKARGDYAKFEIDEPPLVLSLMPVAHSGAGALNHVGLRLIDAKRLVEAQARLETAGYATQREEGVVCCYSRQTKFWVNDPDGTLWELYILHDDNVDQTSRHHESESAEGIATCHPASMACAPAASEALVSLSASRPVKPTAATWLHNLAQPLPERLDLSDDSIDEVYLQGTFNRLHEPAPLARFLAEALRVLRPGGTILAHGLVADRPLEKPPALPGPAALVSHVPLEDWPAETLAAAGWIDVQLTMLAASACFTVDGVELRQFKALGRKPVVEQSPVAATAVYRGPFQMVTDDRGHQFLRGKRVAVCSTTLAALKSGPLAEYFTFLEGAAPSPEWGS